jgi:hypothetical protein
MTRCAPACAAVRRIDITALEPPGVGTCFLAAPNPVLTAHHVVELPEEQPMLVPRVHCRFDCATEEAATRRAAAAP